MSQLTPLSLAKHWASRHGPCSHQVAKHAPQSPHSFRAVNGVEEVVPARATDDGGVPRAVGLGPGEVAGHHPVQVEGVDGEFDESDVVVEGGYHEDLRAQ